jgi:GAF domain-containing protein
VIAQLQRERNLYAKTLTEISRRYEEKIEELTHIRRTSDVLRDALDLDSTCRALVESVRDGGDAASGDERDLSVIFPFQQDAVRRAVSEKRPILATDTGDGKLPSLYLPIVSRDMVIGLFAMHHLGPEVFNDNTIRILTILLNHAAVAVEKARLYQDLKEYSEDLEATP